MSALKFRINFAFTVIASLSVMNAYAGVQVIVNTPPPAREIIVGPPGYSSCYVVPGGFYNGIWQHTHRVCEYQGDTGLRMWVNGYWQCGSYRPGGICTHWGWVGSHWANQRDIHHYRRPMHREQRTYRHAHVQEHSHRQSYEHGSRHGHR